jgi:hypothetical protein
MRSIVGLESITGAIKALLAMFWLRKPAPPPVLIPDASVPPVIPPVTLPAPRKRETGANDASGFYFRDTILDRLDEYFIILERMKKGDRTAYELYSKVGAHVYEIPDGDLRVVNKKLSPWFVKERPGFGAVNYIDGDTRERHRGKFIFPRLFYFQKYGFRGQPRIVQPSKGDIYVCTAYFDEHDSPEWNKHGKHGTPCDFPIAVLPDGTIHPLKVKLHKEKSARHTYGKDRGKKFTIPQTTWGWEDAWVNWAKEHQLNAMEHMSILFCSAANIYEQSNMAVLRVVARKGKIAAVFGVQVKRSAYFFKDREPVIQDGHVKRIFHIVGAHTRNTKKGTTAVHMHFRGLRSFMWKGYQIDITVPGIQGDLTLYDIGAMDMERAKPGEKYWEQSDFANVLAEYQLTGKIEKYPPTKEWHPEDAENNE